jgi:hypothetical protein
MKSDDETTATQLQKILAIHNIHLSLPTIIRLCSLLGWTFRGSSYCQLISTENKIKRLEWAMQYQHNLSIEECFSDVVWTDSTIQMESHRRYCCRKRGSEPKPKPR